MIKSRRVSVFLFRRHFCVGIVISSQYFCFCFVGCRRVRSILFDEFPSSSWNIIAKKNHSHHLQSIICRHVLVVVLACSRRRPSSSSTETCICLCHNERHQKHELLSYAKIDDEEEEEESNSIPSIQYCTSACLLCFYKEVTGLANLLGCQVVPLPSGGLANYNTPDNNDRRKNFRC